jgi:hypothetical protein
MTTQPTPIQPTDERTWEASSPEEQRQYWQSAVQTALEANAHYQALMHENTRLREQLGKSVHIIGEYRRRELTYGYQQWQQRDNHRLGEPGSPVSERAGISAGTPASSGGNTGADRGSLHRAPGGNEHNHQAAPGDHPTAGPAHHTPPPGPGYSTEAPAASTAALQAELDHARGQLEKARRIIRRLRANRKTVPIEAYLQERQRRIEAEQRLDKLFGNPHLKPAQKIGLHYLQRQIEHGKYHDGEGRTRINAKKIGERMGMSGSTGERLIEFCREQLPDLIDIASHKESLPDGTEVHRLYARINNEELLHNPEHIKPLEFRKSGGNRYICQKCGSTDTVIRRHLHCNCCGHEIDLEPGFPNGKPQSGKRKAPQKQVASTVFTLNTYNTAKPELTEASTPLSTIEQNKQEPQKQLAPEDEPATPLRHIYHIGYREPQALTRIDEALTANPTLLLVDIRYTPASQNPNWTKAAFVKRYGNRYRWLRDLGNRNHKERGNIEIANPERGLHQLSDILKEHSIILLCGCPNYQSCHRKTIIELLEEDANLKKICVPESNLPVIGYNQLPPLPGASPGNPSGGEDAGLYAAAELLLDLAGDKEVHIEMSPAGKKKYYAVPGRLILSDVLDHLRGGQARGAICSRRDGKTRGLCWDGDDDAHWQLLVEAARLLVQAGYFPILEKSPADRGGHLWVIYTALVNAEAARQEIYRIAPRLSTLTEYWPGPALDEKWNRVRLPGGRYVRYGRYVEREVNAWCQLISAADGEESRDGQAAAALLLAHQTPVELVPAMCCAPQGGESSGDAPEIPSPAPAPAEAPRSAEAPGDNLRPLPEVDQAWVEKYGPVETTTLWFAVIEDRSAAWFNAQHTLADIRPLERNGMALSPNGDERTASVDYWEGVGGERYTDYSRHGHRPDGTHDSGDPLELAVKVWNRSKSDILNETTRQMVRQAKIELETAAREGLPPPDWVAEIMTPAGWGRYDQLRAGAVRSAFRPGDPVVWRQVPRGGYGYVHPVNAEVVKVGPVKVTIRVRRKDGKEKLIAVASESLERQQVPNDGEVSQEERVSEAGVLPDVAPQPSDPLDLIKLYGERHGWPRFLVDGEELIAEGRPSWMRYLWLSGDRAGQQRVCAEILARGGV